MDHWVVDHHGHEIDGLQDDSPFKPTDRFFSRKMPLVLVYVNVAITTLQRVSD